MPLECGDFLFAVEQHITEHRFKVRSVKDDATGFMYNNLVLNPPGTTQHEVGAAVDLGGIAATGLVDKGTPISPIDQFAAEVGLARPCNSKGGDPVHFQFASTLCKKLIIMGNASGGVPDGPPGAAASPVRVLVTDPQSRRVGFDPVSQTVLNEIGDRAFIIPADGRDPETIVIDAAVEGGYAVSAFSPSGGPYSITTTVNGVEGDNLGTETVRGVAAPGVVIAGSRPILTAATPGLQLALNQSSFTRGDTLTLSGALGTLPIARPVDAYIVVALPGGGFLSLQLNGSFVPGVVPILAASYRLITRQHSRVTDLQALNP